MVLVLAVAMVASDFVRHPFAGAPIGDAASSSRELTVWTAGTDAGRTPARVARLLAQRLDATGARASAETVAGGASTALLALLGPDAPDGALVVVHAGTFADLAVQRGDVGIPGAPAEAERALRLLDAATPIALLADDTLLVAADRRGAVATPAALLASLRRAPRRVVFGIGADAWSKNALATLVESAGAAGRVPYRVLPTAGDAGIALSGEEIDVVLAPASELRGGALRRRLLPLLQSDRGPRLAGDGGVHAPRRPGVRIAAGSAAPPATFGALLGGSTPLRGAHRWIAIVAPPSLPGAARAAAVARVRAVTAAPAWRRLLRRQGLDPNPPGTAAEALRASRRETAALLRAATRIDEAPAPRRSAARTTAPRRSK
jgi:hypothetical protein